MCFLITCYTFFLNPILMRYSPSKISLCKEIFFSIQENIFILGNCLDRKMKKIKGTRAIIRFIFFLKNKRNSYMNILMDLIFYVPCYFKSILKAISKRCLLVISNQKKLQLWWSKSDLMFVEHRPKKKKLHV